MVGDLTKIIFNSVKLIIFFFQSIVMLLMIKSPESMEAFRSICKRKVIALVAAILGLLQISFDIIMVLPVVRKIPRAIFKGNLPIIAISVVMILIVTNKKFFTSLAAAKDFRTALRIGVMWYMLSVTVRFVLNLLPLIQNLQA